MDRGGYSPHQSVDAGELNQVGAGTESRTRTPRKGRGILRRRRKGGESRFSQFVALSRFRGVRGGSYSPRVMDTQVDTCFMFQSRSGQSAPDEQASFSASRPVRAPCVALPPSAENTLPSFSPRGDRGRPRGSRMGRRRTMKACGIAVNRAQDTAFGIPPARFKRLTGSGGVMARHRSRPRETPYILPRGLSGFLADGPVARRTP